MYLMDKKTLAHNWNWLGTMLDMGDPHDLRLAQLRWRDAWRARDGHAAGELTLLTDALAKKLYPSLSVPFIPHAAPRGVDDWEDEFDAGLHVYFSRQSPAKLRLQRASLDEFVAGTVHDLERGISPEKLPLYRMASTLTGALLSASLRDIEVFYEHDGTLNDYDLYRFDLDVLSGALATYALFDAAGVPEAPRAACRAINAYSPSLFLEHPVLQRQHLLVPDAEGIIEAHDAEGRPYRVNVVPEAFGLFSDPMERLFGLQTEILEGISPEQTLRYCSGVDPRFLPVASISPLYDADS